MFETNQINRTTPSSGTVVSLFLHACLALLVFGVVRSPQLHRAVMHKLNIEVMGPQAKRQIAEQHKSVVQPTSSKAQIEPQPKPAAPDAPRIEHADLKPAAPANDNPEALHLPQASAAPVSAHSGGAPSHAGNGESDQRAQSVGRPVSEADLINAYISMLAKLVNGHLIYPREAQKKRIEGISQVSFVVAESGAIRPNTLQIKRGSGNALLDASALKTIQSLAPFQRPPREMTVSLEIEFAVDR